MRISLLLILWGFSSLSLFAQKDPMQFIYILRLNSKYKKEKNWNESVNNVMQQHVGYLTKLHESGQAQLVGRMDLDLNDPAMMGICIFKAPSKEEAQKMMEADPAVQNKIMSAKVYPFKVVFPKGS